MLCESNFFKIDRFLKKNKREDFFQMIDIIEGQGLSKLFLHIIKS